MAYTVAHFFLYLLIIIIIKESLASATLTLKVSSPTLESSGDTLRVSWTSLESPTEIDWLGVYTPSESSDEHFIGYVLLSSVPGWESGNGSYAFPAVNMRAAYQFRLFRGFTATTDTPVDEDMKPIPSTKMRLAVSPVVEFHNYNEPTQVHLSLTSDPSEMSVLFVTKDLVDSVVEFGRAIDNLDSSAVAKVTTYQLKHMCDAPANTSVGWRDPGHIHSAVMTGLEPGVRYFYKVGGARTRWSAIYSFMAPPVAGSETHALLFGDMGTHVPYETFSWTQRESLNTMKWLQRDLRELGDRPTFVSHIGDISYARGYSWLWDNYFTQIEPVAARAPWLVCIGNHEYDWPAQPWNPRWAPYGTDSGGECGVPYSMRFRMPGSSSMPIGDGVPETKNLFYSVNFGAVHFVYMSTETDFLPGSDQYEWIANDLRTTDRKKTPFIVFQGHRPMYSTDGTGMVLPITRKMIQHLEPLLVKNKVSVALWGHVHKYERTCPLQNLTCMGGKQFGDEVFPVHMVIGMGGQDWQPIDEPRVDQPKAPIFPQPSWSLFRTFELGYVRLQATKSVMRIFYVGNHDGKVHDEVEFTSPVDEVDEIVGSEHFDQNQDQVPNRSRSISTFVVDSWFNAAIFFAAAFVLGAGLSAICFVRMYSSTRLSAWESLPSN